MRDDELFYWYSNKLSLAYDIVVVVLPRAEFDEAVGDRAGDLNGGRFWCSSNKCTS